MTDTLQRIKELQKQAVKEILASSYLSKREKLEAIHEAGAWKVNNFLVHLFAEEQLECVEKEKQSAIADGKIPGEHYICRIVDDWIVLADVGDRHETVYFHDLIERLEDALESTYDDECYVDGTVLVAANRGQYKSQVRIPIQDAIDKIFDFAVKNELVGFEIDW